MKAPRSSSLPASLAIVLSCDLPLCALAQQGPQLQSEAARSLQAWVTRPERTAEQRAEDSYRKPAQTLEFFGLQPDMKVVEFFPGGGYCSDIVADTALVMTRVGNGSPWFNMDKYDLGFTDIDMFIDYSPLHYRPDDSLQFDTTRPSINRYSDRFTLKFSKP